MEKNRPPSATGTDTHQTAQIAGAVVNGLNRAREAAAAGFTLSAEQSARLAEALGNARDAQQVAFGRAMAEMQHVRDFVGSPERILGSDLTKHGEIAEHVEVALTNARDLMAGHDPTATFEGVGRLAAEDYIKAGVDVQSKFVNGTSNALDHVAEHMRRYESFGRDGSFYEIPSDQRAQIDQILKGEPVEGLALRTQETIRRKLAEISEMAGRPASDIIRPAQSEYADVQQGVIHKTLDGHEQRLTAENTARVDNLDAQRGQKEAEARDAHDAAAQAEKSTLGEAGKAALAGAAVGAGLRAIAVLNEKRKDGKTFSTLTAEDWQEVGIESAKGGAMGAVSGGSIYLLTNSAGLAAPFAGAVVSSAQAVTSLIASHKKGEITAAECAAMGQIVCAEGAFVACGTLIGQTLIPIPVLGAFVGSTASRLFLNIINEQSGPHAIVVAAQLEKKHAEDMKRLTAEHQVVMAELTARLQHLGDLTTAAFDPKLNAQDMLDASVALAEAYSVQEIIQTDEALDLFILGAEVHRGHEAPRESTRRSA